MAHFAQLNEKNEVVQVIVIHNQELLDPKGIESEWKGIEFCIQHFGGRWIQTSYNGNFRKNYAGIGFTYDEELDAFIPPLCHEEATLDEESARWTCENGEHYVELS
jgi:hypothetical protein